MWHSIAAVAETHQIDAGALRDFAVMHDGRYGIVLDCGEPEVNSLLVGRLVADFKTARGAIARRMWAETD